MDLRFNSPLKADEEMLVTSLPIWMVDIPGLPRNVVASIVVISPAKDLTPAVRKTEAARDSPISNEIVFFKVFLFITLFPGSVCLCGLLCLYFKELSDL